MHGTDTLRRETTTSIQHEDALDEHAGHNHPPGEHAGHDHSQVETEAVEGEGKSIGMKAVDTVGEEQKSGVNKLQSTVDENTE